MTPNEMKYNMLLFYDKLFEYGAPAYDDRQISAILTKAQIRVFKRHYMPAANRYKEGFEQSEQRRADLEQFIKAGSIAGNNTSGIITYACTWTTTTTITIVAGDDLETTIGLNPGQIITGTGIGLVGTPTVNTVAAILSATEFTVIDIPATTGTAETLTGGLGKSISQGQIHPNGIMYDMPSDFLYTIEEAVQTSVSGVEEITVIPIKHDYYRANIRNPYKKPYSNLVWRMDYSRETPADGESTQTVKRSELIVENTNPATTVSEYRLRYLISPPDIVVDDVVPANQKHCILDVTLHDEIIDEAVKVAVAATTPETYQISHTEQKENES